MSDLLVPKRLNIESIFGCNAQCTMCNIDAKTSRKKGAMRMETFRRVIDDLVPYVNQIETMDLWGLGEPLLDPHIFERIRYAKERNFRRIAISTNADPLRGEKQDELLESKIDTVIFSIDGATAKVHESIRKGTNFDRVVRNCEEMVEKRNRGNYATRFVLRFIRQNANRHEWNDYMHHWLPCFSKSRKDQIICHDMHDWSGDIPNEELHLQLLVRDPVIDEAPCRYVFDTLYIMVNGDVVLCAQDWLRASCQLAMSIKRRRLRFLIA